MKALSDAARTELRAIAQGALAAAARGRAFAASPPSHPDARIAAGAFVTLRLRGRLRGCIGRVAAHAPLFEIVAQMARAAALDDPRFAPLGEEEVEHVEIEISVLGPLRPIAGPGDLRIGADGVVIVVGERTGIFLPQVAIEARWGAERLLDEVSLKAGLAREAWRAGASLFAFEVDAF
jgi:AmmeMemoRadiSam system protein A